MSCCATSKLADGQIDEGYYCSWAYGHTGECNLKIRDRPAKTISSVLRKVVGGECGTSRLSTAYTVSGWWCRRDNNHTAPCALEKVMGNDQEKPSASYYARGGVEAKDVIRAWNLNFFLGNVVKYVCRAGYKTPDAIRDLEKARDNLNDEIAALEAALKAESATLTKA